MRVYNSGNVELVSLEDSGTSDWQDFICNQKNVFKVLSSYNRYSSYGGTWEEPVKGIKLTLGTCKQEGGKKECEVKIADNVGLQFNTEYKPKVILWT